MRVVDLIQKKKEGKALTKEEINFIISGYVKGNIPDYQISALLMAIYFQGLNEDEQFNLTVAMLESGDQMDLSSIDGICVDKHSTGGVGDKTSLVVGPIVSACGLKMAKMSGRGLGHTGGTLDKLESIPSFNINLSTEEFYKQVKDIGLAVVGQTLNITPADKKLYALRDVTATIDNIGLIASSIMSKKLASGAHFIILDVKVGDGAFMKTYEDAKKLAKALVSIGAKYGRKVEAILTDMDSPLGDEVGNANEVIEAIETLKGRGSSVFSELCKRISCEFLLMTGFCKSEDEAYKLIDEKIKSKEALNKLKEMIAYQGGNANVVDDYSLLPHPTKNIEVKALKSGYVEKLEALEIGLAAMLLGAGRESKDDKVDLSVGIKVLKHVGDKVMAGDTLAIMYANDKGIEEAYNKIQNAYHIVDKEIDKKPIILGIVKD
ncbi:MAG: pyrimidine-nucleoside phosphorylase [Bacilli bacterium]|nr:pyrimidine-nucleoside phosphorylase [Bacilli bacterium]